MQKVETQTEELVKDNNIMILISSALSKLHLIFIQHSRKHTHELVHMVQIKKKELKIFRTIYSSRTNMTFSKNQCYTKLIKFLVVRSKGKVKTCNEKYHCRLRSCDKKSLRTCNYQKILYKRICLFQKNNTNRCFVKNNLISSIISILRSAIFQVSISILSKANFIQLSAGHIIYITIETLY